MALPRNSEAVDSGDIAALGPGRDAVRVREEEEVGEGGAEVGPVEGGVAGRARDVHVVAAGAEDLGGWLVGMGGWRGGWVVREGGGRGEYCLVRIYVCIHHTYRQAV